MTRCPTSSSELISVATNTTSGILTSLGYLGDFVVSESTALFPTLKDYLTIELEITAVSMFIAMTIANSFS